MLCPFAFVILTNSTAFNNNINNNNIITIIIIIIIIISATLNVSEIFASNNFIATLCPNLN